MNLTEGLPSTAEGWWELAKQMPEVAGPWEMDYTEEQRVGVMMVRRDIRTREPVVRVYGPLYLPTSPFYTDPNAPPHERRWWICAFYGRYSFIHVTDPERKTGAHFDTILKAQRQADIEMKQYNWLLVGAEKEPE